MRTHRWHKKKIALVCLAGIILFLLARRTRNVVTFQFVVNQSDPMVVWEHVADFSNMKHLNPTITGFDIIMEKGNYDHWEYIAEYAEHLSQYPSIKNLSKGHFIVKPDGNDYVILSEHRTCFLSVFCFKSNSEFRFARENNKTRCTESVDYECPFLLTSFCKKEVTFQRSAIMENLKNYYLK
ncbi:uncharacterized protein LOC124155699 [Ischnura elegans]|uniref:uncharacterized protein LOC124155699 n=1 Tax=Ischnura elegans TaxID=197161 RepID=UPI001ED876FA|nr:uncharacterized protein LOC124155699 [Ischnura elegans]XP_046385689.1 uncharacterized protein LOC124155699 [Ischnura elegans]